MRDKKEPQMGSIKIHEAKESVPLWVDCEPVFEVAAELDRALKNYPPFASAHEGYAILLEEVDELKAEVWLRPYKRSKAKMKAECIQVAAMAIRFILDMEGWK